MKATYEFERRAAGPLRTIEIIQYASQHNPVVIHSLESQDLASGLATYFRTVLVPLGYRSPLRTGNVLTVEGEDGVVEFAARDAL